MESRERVAILPNRKRYQFQISRKSPAAQQPHFHGLGGGGAGEFRGHILA